MGSIWISGHHSLSFLGAPLSCWGTVPRLPAFTHICPDSGSFRPYCKRKTGYPWPLVLVGSLEPACGPSGASVLPIWEMESGQLGEGFAGLKHL